MNEIIGYKEVEKKILSIRGQQVLLDKDVAELYGVETKEINQAVKNNHNKFPEGYVITLSNKEKDELVKNFDRFNTLKHSTVLPSAFTEKGLYMLATILKSERAIDATIAIVETFAKMRELANNIAVLNTMDPEVIQPEIIESTGGLLDELLFSGIPTSAKTSMELNLGLMKLKREVTSSRGKTCFDVAQQPCLAPIASQNEFQELKKMIEDIQKQLQTIADNY